MSILSLTLFNMLRRRTLESFRSYQVGDLNMIIKDNMFTMIYMTMLLLITTIPAVLVAIHCNKSQQLMYGSLAFVFSDIYLLQWAIKKFIMNKTGYCPLK